MVCTFRRWRQTNSAHRPIWRAFWLLLLVTGFTQQAGAQAYTDDLTSLPFDQLVKTEVLTASKLARQVSDSPAAVSIVTSDDIRAYGYRTLADVINGMRGLYTSSDRRYDYLGGRGFGRPGDFAGRIMILIDGYAAQDNIYGQVYIDNSGLLDMELIDRVEYVPGTGSVSYGNGAFLGIINVITKNGRDFQAAQVSAEVASFGSNKQRLTFGKQLDNGADVLLSASTLSSAGQSLYFPYFEAAGLNDGWAVGQDGEQAERLFGKFQFEGFTLQAGQSTRSKNSPLPRRENALNKTYQVNDASRFLTAKYEFDINTKLKSASQFYYGSYKDQAFREYGDPDPDDQYLRATTRGQWFGFDQKLVVTHFKNHQIVVGAEYRHDFQQDIGSIGLTSGLVPNEEVDKYAYDTKIFSLYAFDEMVWNDQLTTHLGLRYDRPSSFDCSASPCIDYAYPAKFSPRLALTYAQSPMTTYKASYSEAFRLPTANELPADSWTLLLPERVAATELNVVHDFDAGWRLTGSLYRYQLKDIYYDSSLTGESVYSGSSQTKGLELQLDKSWDGGVRLRTSASWQDAQDPEGKALVNSPKTLLKLNLSLPVLSAWARAGVEAQYLGPRMTSEIRDDADYSVTREGRWIGGVSLVNLTLSSAKTWHGWSAIVSVKNVFDRRFEAVSPRVFSSGGAVLDSLQMDGRSFWLQLSYDWPG